MPDPPRRAYSLWDDLAALETAMIRFRHNSDLAPLDKVEGFATSARKAMEHPLLTFVLLIFSAASMAQTLPPKQASPIAVKQIHSGHSLTDPVFSGHYQSLIAIHLGGVWDNIAKSTIPGSPLSVRWRDAPGYGQPDARHGIAGWELLIITEGVPLAGAGGSSAEYLSLFVNNAWNNGNNGNGTPTLLWTTWTNIDDRDGPWRQRLDSDGAEWERLQDHANANRPSGAPPVYIIPGHKMMARLYDDIQRGMVPGITNISQFFADNIHLNLLGAYAFAMIHYACIFNTSPVGLPHSLVPSLPSHDVPPRLATYLQTMIWDVVTSYPRTGIVLQTDSTDPSVPTGLASPARTRGAAVANLRMERGLLSFEAGAEDLDAVARVASIDGSLASTFHVAIEGPQSYALPSAKSGVWVISLTRPDGSSWSGVRLAR